MKRNLRVFTALLLSLLLVISCAVTAVAEGSEYTSLVRMGGNDRYETANAIASQGWTTSEAVVLASGTSYPDALAGAPLAYALDAPILLVSGKKVNDSVMKQIVALGATKIYILGGKAAVSQEIEDSLTAKNYTVDRIWGQDRYKTSAQISGRLAKISNMFSEAFVVSGENYPDALSVSPIAAIKGCPIVYSNKRGDVDSNAAELIRSSGITTAYVVGGTAAIGSGITSALSACGVSNTERIYGSSRYDTSLKVAKRFVDVFTTKKVAFATGDNYPDALAGGVFAAKKSIPVLLTRAPYVAYESNVYTGEYMSAYNRENSAQTGLRVVEIENSTQAEIQQSGNSYDDFLKELVQFIADFGATEAFVFGGTIALPDLTIRSYFEPLPEPEPEPEPQPEPKPEPEKSFHATICYMMVDDPLVYFDFDEWQRAGYPTTENLSGRFSNKKEYEAHINKLSSSYSGKPVPGVALMLYKLDRNGDFYIDWADIKNNPSKYSEYFVGDYVTGNNGEVDFGIEMSTNYRWIVIINNSSNLIFNEMVQDMFNNRNYSCHTYLVGTEFKELNGTGSCYVVMTACY